VADPQHDDPLRWGEVPSLSALSGVGGSLGEINKYICGDI
jgi:hypothetical protein